MDYLFWVHVCRNILNLVFLYINYDFPKYDFGMLTSDSFFNLSPHYENTPLQIYWKFNHQKLKIFQMKTSDIFHISAQNIDCGYSLEPPRRGGSNEYPQSTF